MKSFAISATLVAYASAVAAIQASKVCVSNFGGYDLNWWVEDLYTGNLGNNSGSYPIDKVRCQDIVVDLLAEGDLLEVNVHAVLGVTKNADTAIIYHASPAITATYHCGGTTLSFECKLDGDEMAAQYKAAGLEFSHDFL